MPSYVNGVHVTLPIADRRRAMEFYRDAFGFELVGTPAEDGVPEPLMFRLDERTLLTLVPAGGFGWVLGEARDPAPSGTSGCLMGVGVRTAEELTALVERVRAAGGEVPSPPEYRPWGFTALCADPDGHVWQVLVQP
ncbi:VOC family protein [Nocardiopsis sp. MG754419]|uniref:VOC family protein n=1 Tax=Nocardiopsis sp. MG754419 TaxID=2259865 RepID=UPI001BAA9D4E|nr:VOC family protein [Nocardiopsis sp. MG754419]MBR8743239.1 VOC family protein [Nocardiopsis sp. MG754419]